MAPQHLDRLNDHQIEAVQHNEGPLAVYAGAGSGKTRVIVHRIVELIQNGVPGSSILAVTFTNKAAREMRERLQQIGGFPARNVSVSTFHSACARFLRIYATELGFTSNFSIADDGDQKAILKRIVQDLRIPETRASVQTFRGKIDRLKNKGITPETYLQQLRDSPEGLQTEVQLSFSRYGEELDPSLVQRVYQKYQEALSAADSMDFNDLLLKMVELLKSNEKVRAQLQNRFRYFLVDEFQDTNPIQFEWIQLLSSHTRNICIVGDDDQSIYSWRGAEPKFIMEFKNYFPDAQVVKLEQNYRSSSNIIQAASQVIAHNRVRAPKTLWTENPAGEKISVVTCGDNTAEGEWIAQHVSEAAAQGMPYSHSAVLYRTNAQSRIIEDELRKRLIPYVIYGSVRFYERAEIKVLLTYLRLLVNHKDNLAFEKCVNVPRRGVGPKALSDLHEVALHHGLTLSQAAARIAYGELPSPFSRGLGGLKKFVDIYTQLKIRLDEGEKSPKILKSLIQEIGFEDYLRTQYPEDFDERWLNVVELQNALTEFVEKAESGEIGEWTDLTPNELAQAAAHPLAAFLESASLTVEPNRQNVEQGSEEAVTLMTVHSAKGLEFEDVCVAGLEEGVLPHMNSMDTAAEIEEERRLLYVAMTRARRKLTLIHVERHRFRRDMPVEPSRFLDEIPIELCRFSNEGPSVRRGFASGSRSALASDRKRAQPHLQRLQDLLLKGDELASRQSTSSSSTTNNPLTDGAPFEVGERVQHKVFGVGVVKSLEKTVGSYRLEIRFPQLGVKRLLHTYVTSLDREQPANGEEKKREEHYDLR